VDLDVSRGAYANGAAGRCSVWRCWQGCRETEHCGLGLVWCEVCYGVSMVMFLHESICMVQMVGVAIIVGGIIVANQG
jgi:hypothetical protein